VAGAGARHPQSRRPAVTGRVQFWHCAKSSELKEPQCRPQRAILLFHTRVAHSDHDTRVRHAFRSWSTFRAMELQSLHIKVRQPHLGVGVERLDVLSQAVGRRCDVIIKKDNVLGQALLYRCSVTSGVLLLRC